MNAIVSRVSGLTRCELCVLRGVARGLRDQEIADDLGRSIHTVRVHVRHIKAKLGMNRRVNLIRLGAEISLAPRIVRD